MKTQEMTPGALVDLFETMVARRHEMSEKDREIRDHGIRLVRDAIIGRMSPAVAREDGATV